MRTGFGQDGLADRASGLCVGCLWDETDGGKPDAVLVEFRAVLGANSGELVETAELVVDVSQLIA